MHGKLGRARTRECVVGPQNNLKHLGHLNKHCRPATVLPNLDISFPFPIPHSRLDLFLGEQVITKQHHLLQDNQANIFNQQDSLNSEIFESQSFNALTDVPPHLPLNALPPVYHCHLPGSISRLNSTRSWSFVFAFRNSLPISKLVSTPQCKLQSSCCHLRPFPVPSQFSARRADDLQLHRDVHRATPKPGLDRVLPAHIHHSFFFLSRQPPL